MRCNIIKNSRGVIRGVIIVLLVIFFIIDLSFAGVTGKIAGRIIDSQNEEPIIGANVFLEKLQLGAASDIDGFYFILNVPPGEYTVVCTMIGYATTKKQKVIVNADHTTTIEFEMVSEELWSEEIVVEAERPIIERDVSGSEMVMREEDIEVFAQDAFQDFLGAQVGVDYTASEDGSGISIRGGDINETNVLVNEVSLRNAITQQASLGISMTSIKEVNIRTGGFTAEYGDIRSGLVNVITKEGSRDHFSIALDVRIAPPQMKHFGPNPYAVNGPVWNVYCGSKAYDGVTEEDVASGNYAFAFTGWNNWAEERLNDTDPDNDYTPQQWMEIWRWHHRNIDYADTPDYILDGSIGGPLPFLDATFLLSQHYDNLQIAYPYSRNSSLLSTTQLGITFRISPQTKLTWTNIYTFEEGVATQEVDYSFGMISGTPQGTELARDVRWHMLYNPYGINPINRNTYHTGLKWSQVLNPSTFFNISLTGTYYNAYQGVKNHRNMEKNVKIGNVWMDSTPDGYYYKSDQYDMFDQFWIYGGGGQIDDSDYWQLRLKGLLESQISFSNQIKVGFEMSFTDFNMQASKVHQDKYQNGEYFPPDFVAGTVPMNTYYFANRPFQLAAFMQDKLEYMGMIANLGLRFDLFNPAIAAWDVSNWNTYYTYENWQQDVRFTQQQKGSNAMQYRFSPRVGVSFPATENSKFYFNYGHFYQLPIPERLFNIDLDGGSPPFTLPNLSAKWPRTVSYEVGYEHALSNTFLVRISGYYKDVTNQLSEQEWYDYNRNLLYVTDDNNSYEDIRGVELRIQQRQGRFGYGWLDFEYMSVSEGWTGFEAMHQNWQYEQEQREDAEQEKDWPIPRIRLVYSFRLPRDFGPAIGGIKPLSDWTFQIDAYWRDGGKRIFDPSAPVWARHYVENIDRHNVNLILRKRFEFGNLDFSLFMRVRNATNFKGPVQPFSGEEYRNSLHLPWLQGDMYGNDKYGEGPSDEKPWINAGWQTWRQYTNPRHIMFGVELNFRIGTGF
jgi:outer membrane receptor protein involved in Fe transport